MRRALPALLLAILVLPAAALAGQVKDVDASEFPSVRVVYVGAVESLSAPAVLENGRAVAGLSAINLGRAKSVVLAIDNSRSMRGEPLEDAAAAARAFIAAKPPGDRIAVTVFGETASSLTGFSTATIDADTALRSLALDDVKGTALYDAVVLATGLLAGEPLPARVLILLTDGADFRSAASLEEAVAAAKEAGVAVYPIGIESRGFRPDPLEQLAAETGGTYYGTASTDALAAVYDEIAGELARTWQLEYVTSARPGDRLALEVRAAGETARAELVVPGTAPSPPPRPEPNRLLPEAFYTSAWGVPVVGAVVGFLVLLAAGLALASPRGAWLRGRLAPHVGSPKRELKVHEERDRLAAAAGVFRATEKAFGNGRVWKKLGRTLERADVPLRTAEFAYIMVGCAFAAGLLAAVLAPPALVILAAFAAGGLLPYGVVAHKARKRLKAFENQLPDMLVTMAASLKAGHSFRQGMQSVVDEGQDPAAREFKRVLTETRLGRPMDDALAEMAQRVGSQNFEFVMSAVTIQRQVGGSLATLFDMVADTVRQRHQFHRKVRGLTAMGRVSAYVLVGLPFFLALAITAINREYMEPLHTTSGGKKMVLLGLVMIAIGSAILKKIVSFKG